MEKPVIMIPPSRLKSPLIPAAAVLYLLAALAGLPGMVLLANPEYRSFLMQDLASSGITDASSLNSFQLINSVVTLLACFGPALISAGLLISLRSKPVQGIGLLSTAAQWLIYGVNASGCVAAVVFVFRFFRYLFIFGSDARGLVAVYSMILCEALMGHSGSFSVLPDSEILKLLHRQLHQHRLYPRHRKAGRPFHSQFFRDGIPDYFDRGHGSGNQPAVHTDRGDQNRSQLLQACGCIPSRSVGRGHLPDSRQCGKFSDVPLPAPV